MCRIFLTVLFLGFLLGGVSMIDGGDRQGLLFIFFSVHLLGIIFGITVSIGTVYDHKTKSFSIL